MSHHDELAWRETVESANRQPSGWSAPSRCVYRRESAFKRVWRAIFGL